MSKPDLIVCVADMGRIPSEFQDEARRMQTTLVDYSGKARCKNNERMGYEKKAEPDCVNPSFPDLPTHQRLGPWLIDGEADCYCPEFLGDGSFAKVYTFWFHYSPLPESDNPWVRINKTVPALNELPAHARQAMGLETAGVSA